MVPEHSYGKAIQELQVRYLCNGEMDDRPSVNISLAVPFKGLCRYYSSDRAEEKRKTFHF